MRMRNWLFATLLAFGMSVSALAVSACDSDEADELLQCADICNAFIDCTNSEADVDDCIDQCEEQESNTSAAFEGCEDCVDSNACENNVWQCETECAAVIDQSTIVDDV
jgi:hypothetical protein